MDSTVLSRQKDKFFFTKLTMQNIDEFLLRKHCKEGASVATQFLTHVFDIFSKNPKIEKNKENPKKYVFNIFLSF